MKKFIIMMCSMVLVFGVLAGCGKGASKQEVDVPVEEILQAVKDAYGKTYLPDAPMEEQMLTEMYGIDMSLIESYAAEMPLIGFHPDRVIIAKAAEGKGEELEKAFQAVKKQLLEEGFMYPANIAKTNAAQIVRNGDYVAFLLVGAPNENMDASEEEQLKFAEDEVQKAVDAFNSFFES